MNEEQREAALRLIVRLDTAPAPLRDPDLNDDAAALLRELLAEPQGEPMPGMSLMNRTIAYCAADTLRKLGYEWNGEAWLAAEPVQEPVVWLSRDEARLALWEAIHKRDYGNPTDDKLILKALHKAGFWIGRLVTAEPQAEPVRECADNDSPWLVCKTCAAVGRCAKLPVAWRSKERINGEFDSGWKLTSNEPPQTPRTIAIEPLYTHPQQQRQPLTRQQVQELLTAHFDNDTLCGDDMTLVRAVEAAHGITGSKE